MHLVRAGAGRHDMRRRFETAKILDHSTHRVSCVACIVRVRISTEFCLGDSLSFRVREEGFPFCRLLFPPQRRTYAQLNEGMDFPTPFALQSTAFLVTSQQFVVRSMLTHTAAFVARLAAADESAQQEDPASGGAGGEGGSMQRRSHRGAATEAGQEAGPASRAGGGERNGVPEHLVACAWCFKK